METFDIQRFAVPSGYGYFFINPDSASIRIPVNTNADGEIAIDGDEYAATKSFTFPNTKVSATAYEIIHGTTYNTDEPASTSGIVSTFITYLLGAEPNLTNMKRTIVQNTYQGYVPPEPSPDDDPQVVG